MHNLDRPVAEFGERISNLDRSKNRCQFGVNRCFRMAGDEGIGNGGATGFFDSDERLKALSWPATHWRGLRRVIDF
jgi:hypothetical protein